MFVSLILHGFFYGITIPLLWAMIADVADYSEWKNNRRATAIIFSAMLCGLKIGLSDRRCAGRGHARLLRLRGRTLPVQSPQTVDGIRLAVSIYCSIPFLLCVVLLFLYQINKTMEIAHRAGTGCTQAAGRRRCLIRNAPLEGNRHG